MFRDLKEYQEIAKIYAEKVSKPEDLDENRNTRGKELAAKRLAEKPKTREELGLPPKKKPSPFERKFGKERNEKRLIQSGLKKKLPTTDEIKKANPNVVPGTRVNEIGQKSNKPSEGDFKKDFPDKKPEPPKPKKMHSIEKKNRARLGDAKVDALKAKNKDFQLMKKGGMSKDDFIKKYPKSITAQKAAGLRDHTEWDAYDMVLEYLFSTEQVSTLEEANYVMMEMEQQTIGEIVKEVKEALVNEGMLQSYIKPTMPLLRDKRTGEYMTTDGKPFDMNKFKKEKEKPQTGK